MQRYKFPLKVLLCCIIGIFPACRLPPLHPPLPPLPISPLSLRRWISDDWEHCPRTCGSLGFQIRTVRCVQFLHDGTNRSVHSKYCSGEKPESRRACNRVPCPAPWRTGAWSEVRTDACQFFSHGECIFEMSTPPFFLKYHRV